MNEKPISRYPIPEFDKLPKDIQEMMIQVQEKAGFIPNVFLSMAHRPAEMRAFFAYHNAIMEKDSGLNKTEMEMIIVATSSDNGCQYCVIAHGAVLRIRAKDPLIADQVAINYKKADISDRQKTMLDFAMKVSNDSRSIEQSDHERMQEQGFSKEDIWDIAAITSFFGLSNRMANTMAIRPNDEFYTMGREVKEA